MSYIRCTTNPENIYVWGTGDGKVQFSWGNILNQISFPKKDFDKLINLYADLYHDIIDSPLEVGDLRLEEDIFDGELRVKLSYGKDFEILMYVSTWEYIVYQNADIYNVYSWKTIWNVIKNKVGTLL